MSNKRQEPADSTSDLNIAVKSKKDKNNAAKAEDKSKEGEESCKSVPLFKLFVLADTLDVALMSMGTIASVANGLAFPMATILFGNLLNAFGRGNELVQEVSKVALLFIYLGAGVAVASFFRENLHLSPVVFHSHCNKSIKQVNFKTPLFLFYFW